MLCLPGSLDPGHSFLCPSTRSQSTVASNRSSQCVQTRRNQIQPMIAAMWKREVKGMICLEVTPGVADISPPICLADHKNRSRRATSKPTPPTHLDSKPSSLPKSRPTKTSTAGLLGLSPDLWNEQKVIAYLATAKTKPPIAKVVEMHARINASHKFLCRFVNAHDSFCDVWIPDTILFRHYPDQYASAKSRFIREVQR